MEVTIQDAINAFALLKDSVNENGFLFECYNLAISALKTVQDGGYQLQPITKVQEIMEKMAKFDCEGKYCEGCLFHETSGKLKYTCASIQAGYIIEEPQLRKELEQWIQENYSKISQKL